MDSFQTSFLALCISKLSVKLKMQSKMKINWKIIKFKRLLLTTYVGKMSYFEVATPGYTIAYKNVNNLLKNGKYIF